MVGTPGMVIRGVITSFHNKRVAKAVRLKKRAMREKARLFLVEGVQAVSEALSSPGAVQELFYTPASRDRVDPVLRSAQRSEVTAHPVSEDVMAHLTSTVTPQGVVGVTAFVDVPLGEVPPEGGCVPVLVEVRDPGNAGTILRSADASGAEAVVFTRSSVDVYNPKAVRATAGSLFHVPVVREMETEEAVTALRQRGYAVLAADAEGPRSVYEADLTAPTAVLFGNEARGLPGSALDLADAVVRVPIRGRAESLNLAAAATLVLFEASRQRSGSVTDSLAAIVSGAAHDIRSPLTALRGFGTTLLSRWERLDDQQRRMMLEGMVHDAARMEVIVAQVVDGARLRSGRLELSPVPTDVLEAARKVREDLGGWGTVEVEVRGDPVRVLADPARLRTILHALVEGAHWWGEHGPVVIESVSAAPPTVRVYREGSTVDPADAEGVFRLRRPGTGGASKVGLFVARGLAEAHGGAIEVSAEGTFGFVLSLPRLDETATGRPPVGR